MKHQRRFAFCLASLVAVAAFPALVRAFGADPQAADDGGATPLDLATRARNKTLVQVLAHPVTPARSGLGALPSVAAKPQPVLTPGGRLTRAGPSESESIGPAGRLHY